MVRDCHKYAFNSPKYVFFTTKTRKVFLHIANLFVHLLLRRRSVLERSNPESPPQTLPRARAISLFDDSIVSRSPDSWLDILLARSNVPPRWLGCVTRLWSHPIQSSRRSSNRQRSSSSRKPKRGGNPAVPLSHTLSAYHPNGDRRCSPPCNQSFPMLHEQVAAHALDGDASTIAGGRAGWRCKHHNGRRVGRISYWMEMQAPMHHSCWTPRRCKHHSGSAQPDSHAAPHSHGAETRRLWLDDVQFCITLLCN
jgi:hypothetical protein